MKIILPTECEMRSPSFVFGVATSSFQIEGAADSRLPSIWDTFCDTPGKISDQSDGRVACDHYSRWQEDVELLENLGVDAYRLSISWPRVINSDGSLNADGTDFYVRLLDTLREKGIKPFVTLYHWDLPQHLEDQGGWLNRETAYHFRDYVEKISKAFGDRVYSYATLNEPFCSAYLGYEIGIHAPGLTGKSYGKKAAHNLLLAHGLGMQVLRKTSPDTLNGIVLNFSPCYGATSSPEDQAAATAADEQFNQWYLKPLIDGCYPELIERLPDSDLPDIVEGDFDIISQPLDFLGVNYYTRSIYRADDTEDFVLVEPVAGPVTDMGWEIYPQGLTELLISLNESYDLPPIYIAENGAAMADTIDNGEIKDIERIEYLQTHLVAVNRAIERGVNISGYFYWCLMDNFEWAHGYTKQFGLVHVDFETQERIPKASGYAFRDLLKQRHQTAPIS